VAANRHAEELKAQGADIVVLLVHEGAETTALSSATDPATDFGKIVTGVNDDVDAIISGHTHLAYNHSVTVPGWVSEGRPVTTRPVVSAGQYGYNLDQLLFTVDPDTDKVLGLQQSTLPLVKTPAYPTDAPTQAIVDKAVADAAVLGAQPLGQITGPFNRARTSAAAENRGGESTLGNLVAEVQQTATESATTGSAQIAFMNPGGLRTDMAGTGPTYPTTLTYKQAANVQPFANTLVNMRLTGAHIKAALEQQWQPAGSARPFLKLGTSEGFTYTYDPRAAAGSRISEMWLNGQPIAPASIYSVTVNSFLASGGDNFGAFALGTSKKDTGQTDLQAMVDFMADRKTVSPDFTQRAVGVLFPAGAPASYLPGEKVSFDLSSLAFSTAADLKDSSVRVSLGDTQLGTFAVDNTLGTAVTDEYGTASVSVVLPSSVTAGVQHLTVTGAQTGTTTTVPVTVAALVTTTTTLAASATSQTYGTSTPATLTATVAQGDGATPSGSVRFETFGGTTLATVSVVDGKASYEVPASTPAGTLQITATFLPSAATGISGSSSSVVTFTVDKAVSSTTLTATGSKVKVRGATTYAIAMTATVSLDTGKPAVGTVTFYAAGRVVGSAAVGTGGKASLTVPTTKGSVQVRAQFTPTDTANHLASTSPTLTVTVK
jgi:5'-nucleotidase